MKRVVIDTNVIVSSIISPSGNPAKIMNLFFSDEIQLIFNALGLSDVPMLDEDDRVFYDTAKESGAILVTGNTKHFPAESFIMTPSDFLAYLEKNG